MNRFPTTRRNQILAWTGAALAWGTTFLASKVEPERVEPDETSASESTAQITEAMPQIPESGLTVIRYRPERQAEQAFVPAGAANPAPPASTPPPPAPAPASSGS